MRNGLIPDGALLEAFEEGIALDPEERPAVINMSCGSQILRKVQYTFSFELIAQRVLKSGILLVAAAGNGDFTYPVNHPANCPSVMAVGALDANLEPLPQSCSRENCDGEVDLCAPGFEIRSSTTALLNYYNNRTGTSSATALVSGIAALWAQKGYRGCDLWNVIVDKAIPVTNGSRKRTGAGMVQAPSDGKPK
jgi:subtilisin family serine protease